MNNKKNRYQYQKWYVKLWRRRWYLKIPLDAIRIWFANRKKKDDLSTFTFALALAIGEAQYKMNWLYDINEVFPNYESEDK
jgi:hypothetical protein